MYFREPDIGNELTAVACVVDEDDRKIFEGMKLL